MSSFRKRPSRKRAGLAGNRTLRMGLLGAVLAFGPLAAMNLVEDTQAGRAITQTVIDLRQASSPAPRMTTAEQAMREADIDIGSPRGALMDLPRTIADGVTLVAVNTEDSSRAPQIIVEIVQSEFQSRRLALREAARAGGASCEMPLPEATLRFQDPATREIYRSMDANAFFC